MVWIGEQPVGLEEQVVVVELSLAGFGALVFTYHGVGEIEQLQAEVGGFGSGRSIEVPLEAFVERTAQSSACVFIVVEIGLRGPVVCFADALDANEWSERCKVSLL